MKSNLKSKQVFTWLAGAILASACSVPAYAVDCNNPRGSVETRACAKAKEGPDALRRFIDRTRMIYALDYQDYAPKYNESQVAASPGGEKIAGAK